MINYKNKYLKYKNKYLKYKKNNIQKAGGYMDIFTTNLKYYGFIRPETPEEKQEEALMNYITKRQYIEEQIKTLEDDITKSNTELYDTNKKLENINECSDKYEENLILLNNHIRHISNKLYKNEKNLKDLREQKHNCTERIDTHTEIREATNVTECDLSNYHRTFKDNVSKPNRTAYMKNVFSDMPLNNDFELVDRGPVPDCEDSSLG